MGENEIRNQGLIMASIVNDQNGTKRIVFAFVGSKSRKAIRLGKVSAKFAAKFCDKVEEIACDVFEARPHSAETMIWLKELHPTLRARLAKSGLVRSSVRTARNLKPFLVDYFAAIAVKPGTAIAYKHTQRCLLDNFGDVPLHDIGPEQGEKFRQYLQKSGLSTATVSRRVKVARQMFAMAKRWKLIEENPFADVATGSEKNRSRLRFISEETAAKVIDACPDTEWKLLFALSRWGGLRCPSEHLALTWADIDWATDRFRVRSSKTEHHEGGGSRMVPIFPELRPFLQDQFELAEPGAVHVIARHRSSNINLRTRLLKIIEKAGLQPWPKLFHNLRATRQTELAESNPIHVVCAWIGNSESVAKGHYLQVTDEHFRKAAQKAARQPATIGANGAQSDGENMEKPAKTQFLANHEGTGMGAVGREASCKSRGKQGRPDQNGAKSGALDQIPDEQRIRPALKAIKAYFASVEKGAAK